MIYTYVPHAYYSFQQPKSLTWRTIWDAFVCLLPIDSPSVRGMGTEFSYTTQMVPRVAFNIEVIHSTVYFPGKVIWSVTVLPTREWALNKRLDPLTLRMIQYYAYLFSLPHPTSQPEHPIPPPPPPLTLQYQWGLGRIYVNAAQCNV